MVPFGQFPQGSLVMKRPYVTESPDPVSPRCHPGKPLPAIQKTTKAAHRYQYQTRAIPRLPSANACLHTVASTRSSVKSVIAPPSIRNGNRPFRIVCIHQRSGPPTPPRCSVRSERGMLRQQLHGS